MAEYTDLEFLVRYKAWADDVFYKAVSQIPDEDLKKQRPMLFGSLISLLKHIYAMDVVWKSHLDGVVHNLDSRNPENTSSFAELRSDQVAVNNWYVRYVEALGLEKYNEVVKFSFIGGGEGKMRRTEILQHVVNHASYHRGHIEGVLYSMSIEPPTTDIPVFIQERAA